MSLNDNLLTEQNFNKAGRFIIGMFVFVGMALASGLTLLGWAIYRLVIAYT